jgi:hypothetical protein
MNQKGILFSLIFLLLSVCLLAQEPAVWTKKQANAWYAKQEWLVGANFLPSTAINQLEMWQEDTWDPTTIDRELGWAAAVGMNVMRVYLHDLAWKADPEGFKRRMDQFLSIASNPRIKILFTIFDDCWNPDAAIGKQPEPKPGIHNSGWVRSPSKATHDAPGQWDYLQAYVVDVLTAFKQDERILMWDLYNEPGNSGYNEGSMLLLEKAFQWAWSVRPSQPLTTATWYNNKNLNDFALANSDVITFHNYNDLESLKKEILEKRKLGKPLICSEYMARTRNSRFETHLPVFKKYRVGAINWGLVAGKSNTMYQWDTPIPDGSEPKTWFHDVFRKDGTPYSQKEIEIIKRLTNQIN